MDIAELQDLVIDDRERGIFRVNRRVFTDPEIAWTGLTETQAQKDGREIKVAKFPWAASGRAMTIDRTEGMTKLILDPASERVLGVGIVGAGAGELIAEGTLAIEMAATATVRYSNIMAIYSTDSVM